MRRLFVIPNLRNFSEQIFCSAGQVGFNSTLAAIRTQVRLQVTLEFVLARCAPKLVLCHAFSRAFLV